MTEKEKEKETKERFELVEVPTEMGLVCKDNETDTNFSQFELVIQLANDISEIKKGIIGGK